MKQSSKGVCHICDEVFDESDLVEINDLFFCKNDAKIYKDSSWREVDSILVSPTNNQDALKLQDKKDLYKAKNIPSFILSEYEINENQTWTKSKLYLRIQDIKKA